jgi:hypothetical protein
VVFLNSFVLFFLLDWKCIEKQKRQQCLERLAKTGDLENRASPFVFWLVASPWLVFWAETSGQDNVYKTSCCVWLIVQQIYVVKTGNLQCLQFYICSSRMPTYDHPKTWTAPVLKLFLPKTNPQQVSILATQSNVKSNKPFITILINPVKTKRICFIQGLSAYRAVNTLHFGYKNQSLNVL